MKIFDFQKNYTRDDKNVGDKIVHLKNIYKFTSDHFFIGRVYGEKYRTDKLFFAVSTKF